LALSFRVRKLVAWWALGPRRFIGLAPYSLFRRLSGRIAKSIWPEETYAFVLGVVTAGGQVARSGDPARTVRAEQRLDDIRAPFTAFVRPRTSDLQVWNEVVRDRQYAPVVRALRAAAIEVETILDLGANIGLTAAYFGAVYPNARILAVEPDPGNFQLLKRNTEALGDRVRVEEAAFWPRHEPLSWTSKRFRDGREWARAVEGTESRGDSVDAMTPTEALAHLEVERADLAKVDIEGAEAAFFATEEDTETFLGLADVFAIELHLESVDPVKAAMAFGRAGFLTVPVGELVIAMRRERVGTRQNGLLLEPDPEVADNIAAIETFADMPEPEHRTYVYAAWSTWNAHFNPEINYPRFVKDVLGRSEPSE
jgi:FkbM family methyltransferase